MRHIDIAEFRLLWCAGWTVDELAAKYGVTRTCILALKAKYRFLNRNSPQCSEDPAPIPEDAAASEDSLRLSPWVQARIRELGLGMPTNA